MILKKYTRDDVWAIAVEGIAPNIIEEEKESIIDSFNEFYTARKMIANMLVSNTINAPLVINKFITLLNEFGSTKTTIIFRMICDDVNFSVAKAILIYLRKYDFKLLDPTPENRIMVDILKDLQRKYDLEHIN